MKINRSTCHYNISKVPGNSCRGNCQKRVLLEPHVSPKVQHGNEAGCSVCLLRELCASYQYKLDKYRLKDFVEVTARESLIKCMSRKITACIILYYNTVLHCTVKNYIAYRKHPSCGWILGYVQYLPHTITSAAFWS